MDQSSVLPHYVGHRLNSRVISAALGHPGRHVELRRPVRVTLRHLDAPDGKDGPVAGESFSSLLADPICVFWDLESRRWSDAGCRVADTNSTTTVCECDHLTHFALMMRPAQPGETAPSVVEDGGAAVAHSNNVIVDHLDVFVSVLAAVIVFAVFISVMVVSETDDNGASRRWKKRKVSYIRLAARTERWNRDGDVLSSIPSY